MKAFWLHGTGNTVWEFVSERTLQGKDAIRQWMVRAYAEPTNHFITEGDFVTAMGRISLKDKTGEAASYSCYDVWCFWGDKLAD